MFQSSIIVICNSGSNAQDRAKLANNIRQKFLNANREVQLIIPSANDDFRQLCKQWVREAKQTGSVVVAAGGDGTVNCIAALCYREQVLLGVIPLGTFNYFAREHNIPIDIPQAVKIIIGAHAKKVAVGVVQDEVFLNNASFGLYTKLIRQREQASSRFGRIRIVAVFSAVYSLFSRQKLFDVDVSTDGQRNVYKTAMVFVGNNTLQLENLGMKGADFTQRDKLAIVIMKKVTRFEIARMLLFGMVSNLRGEPNLKELSADRFEVTTRRKSISLVIDGEIISCPTPLKFHIEKNALNLLAPSPEPST